MAKEHSEKFFGACGLCGDDINSSNKIESHALTESVYSDEMPLGHGEHLIMLRMENGKIIEGDFGHFETETGILCKKCDEGLKIYEDERTAFFRENIIIDFEGQTDKTFDKYDYKK